MHCSNPQVVVEEFNVCPVSDFWSHCAILALCPKATKQRIGAFATQ